MKPDGVTVTLLLFIAVGASVTFVLLKRRSTTSADLTFDSVSVTS